MIPTCVRFSINKTNTRSFPGANIGIDHDLVLTTIELKLKTMCFTQSPRGRFDMEKLKHPEIAEVFLAKIDRKFAALCVFDSDVGTLLNSLEVPLSTTVEVLGRQRKKSQD